MEYYYPEGPIQLDTSIIPNPFRGVSSDTYPDSDQAYLTLVDGGLDGEVTPYQPLLVKARGVDTIVAIDGVSFVSFIHPVSCTEMRLPGCGYH